MAEYGPELAALHHAHFGDVARRAAACLVAELARAERHGGTVVDLGSGSGILAALVGAAGFDVVGVDGSDAMLALAREHAPRASFVRGSAWTSALPRCVAVCAVGEVFNYTFAAAGSRDLGSRDLGSRDLGAHEPGAHDLGALERRLVEIRAALEPGGVLLFDLSGPGRVAGGERTLEYDFGEWRMTMTLREDGARRSMVREHRLRRRDDHGELVERHELALFAPDDVQAALGRAGFALESRRDYGEPNPRPGWRVFCARADDAAARR
ncbi:MAG: methyltransferase domain-containing protein [Planctomycetes bacterium]|nr:methyltransferase domain-containing protein [Planctomycetota bacterium]